MAGGIFSPALERISVCSSSPRFGILAVPIDILEVDLTYLVIALVEYLTSEEAGEPLAGRFAWPVDIFLRKRPRSTPNIVRTGYGTLSKSNRKQDI